MSNSEGYHDKTAEVAIFNVMKEQKKGNGMYNYDQGSSYHYDMEGITQQDGGSGSGNWGHAGRPGKRGGSAGGGGVAHRTGSKEKGFSSEAKEIKEKNI